MTSSEGKDIVERMEMIVRRVAAEVDGLKLQSPYTEALQVRIDAVECLYDEVCYIAGVGKYAGNESAKCLGPKSETNEALVSKNLTRSEAFGDLDMRDHDLRTLRFACDRLQSENENLFESREAVRHELSLAKREIERLQKELAEAMDSIELIRSDLYDGADQPSKPYDVP